MENLKLVLDIYKNSRVFTNSNEKELFLEIDKKMDTVIDNIYKIKKDDLTIEDVLAAFCLITIEKKITEIGIEFDDSTINKMSMIKQNIYQFIKDMEQRPDNELESIKLVMNSEMFHPVINSDAILLLCNGIVEKYVNRPMKDLEEKVNNQYKPTMAVIGEDEDTSREALEQVDEELFDTFDCRNIVDKPFNSDDISNYPDLAYIQKARYLIVEEKVSETNETVEEGLFMVDITRKYRINYARLVDEFLLILNDIIYNYKKVDAEVREEYRAYYNNISDIIIELNSTLRLVNYTDSVLNRKVNEATVVMG